MICIEVWHKVWNFINRSKPSFCCFLHGSLPSPADWLATSCSGLVNACCLGAVPGRRNRSHPLCTSPSAAGAGLENDSQSPQSVCQRLPVKRPSSEVPQQLQPSTRHGPHGRGKSHIASRRTDVSTLCPDAPPSPPQLLQGDVACRWDPHGWDGARPGPRWAERRGRGGQAEGTALWAKQKLLVNPLPEAIYLTSASSRSLPTPEREAPS